MGKGYFASFVRSNARAMALMPPVSLPRIMGTSISGANPAAYTAEIEGNSVKITCWGGSTTPLTVTASYGEYSTGAEIGLKGI